MGRTHLDPKSKKKCILFSSIFNVDRPFQRYLLKTSGPGENNPITKRKNNFFSKFPRCKISTSTFSEIGNKKKINGFGVWSGPFFSTWVHLKGSVAHLVHQGHRHDFQWAMKMINAPSHRMSGWGSEEGDKGRKQGVRGS